MERYKAREIELWFAISCNNEKRSLLWYPDAFSVWSKEKPSLLTIRKLLHQDRFLVFSLLVITTLFIHTPSLADTRTEGNIAHSAAPFYSTELIPGTGASSAENNHSCVWWESAANESAADDMTCLHPTAPSSGTDARKTKMLAGEPEVKVETENYFEWQKKI